jgi:PilZ domain
MTPHLDERRVSPRCDVVKNRASIEFAAPEGRRRIGGTLVNISRGGALVVADKQMLRAVPLSLRIESPVRTDWVDANVVRFDPNREIGLHFPQGCPYDLLLAGTVGIDLAFLVRNEVNGTTAFD